MTQPSEEQVRAWLKQSADEFVMFAQVSRGHGLEDDARRYEGTEHLYRAALALLDAGRKDRERLDWIDGKSLDGIHVEVWAKGNADIRVEREACVYWRNVEVKCDNVRAAIDQARGA